MAQIAILTVCLIPEKITEIHSGICLRWLTLGRGLSCCSTAAVVVVVHSSSRTDIEIATAAHGGLTWGIHYPWWGKKSMPLAQHLELIYTERAVQGQLK